MTDLFELVEQMVKRAAEVKTARQRKQYILFGKPIQRAEALNLETAVKKVEEQTPEEKKVQQLVGRKPTKGQLGRWALIGAGAGTGGHLVRSALEGAADGWLPKSVVKPGKQVLHPRRLAGAAAVGAIYGSALPVSRRLWDIQTARTKPESF
jgi:hypothetical protein